MAKQVYEKIFNITKYQCNANKITTTVRNHLTSFMLTIIKSKTISGIGEDMDNLC